MKTSSSIAAVVIAASTLFACGGQGQTNAGATASKGATTKQGEVIATVGGEVITTADFEARMDEQSPFIRARYNTLERKKEFLDNMIRFEVLAQEAERRGLQNDPEVIATARKVMVQKLMRAEFDDSAAAEFPESELRAFYEANISDYVKPERVRVSHIFLAADASNRSKVRSEASRLLAEVKGKEAGPIKTAFAETAKTRSDDAASKAAGGDLLFKTREELVQAWGEKFADAVFAMKNIGDIGAVVESDKGFHLVKLTGRQNALDRPFEAVKAQIQNRLFREKRTKAFEDFVAKLKEQANVQIREDVLAALEVAPPKGEAHGAAPDADPAAAPAAPAAVPAAGTAAPEAAPAKAERSPRTIKLEGPQGRTMNIPASALEKQPRLKPKAD